MKNIRNPEKDYANQWNVSAEFFYDKGYYSWMAQAVKEFHTVVEIGCGTGYSTLALLEEGHSVIAIDCNSACIAKAQSLLQSKGLLNEKVVFIEGDIANPLFRAKVVSTFSFDAVLCWNVGSYWGKEMIQHYLPYLHEYGLDDDQIIADPESSYAELVIWNTCRLASEKQVPIHIVERGVEALNQDNDPYYSVLKNEIGCRNVSYSNKEAESISKGGRVLSVKGVPVERDIMDIVFTSILLT